MENASFAKIRLESSPFNTKKGIGALTAVKVLGLLVCLIIGMNGPRVFDRAADKVETESLEVTWYGQIFGMEPWHQVLFLHMRLKKPLSIGAVAYEQRYSVSSWASEETDNNVICPDDEADCVELSEGVMMDRTIKCGDDKTWCDWTTLITEDFVQYKSYYMQVNMEEPEIFDHMSDFELGFEIVFITSKFTVFQMASHYAWTALTLCFMFLPKIGFFTEMNKLHSNFWSRQQVRIGVLLVALLFFNNIFFAAQILSPLPRLFFSVYVIFLATFLSLILFYWLELFGDLAAGNMQGKDTAQDWERNRKKTLLEYLPKLILVGLIWFLTILVYIYVRVKQTGDPSYSSYDDLTSYTNVKILSLTLATIYFGWLGFLIMGSFHHVRDMGIEYKFILGITLFTIFGSLAAVYTGALAPDQHGAKVFSFFYGLFNLYVLLLAFCYTPVGSVYGNIQTQDEMEMIPNTGKEDDFAIVGSSHQQAV